MKECICRLDVAMFNAILQEDSIKVPAESVSDPIGVKFLPIPAGNLSFGFGVQLKSSVCILFSICYHLFFVISVPWGSCLHASYAFHFRLE